MKNIMMIVCFLAACALPAASAGLVQESMQEDSKTKATLEKALTKREITIGARDISQKLYNDFRDVTNFAKSYENQINDYNTTYANDSDIRIAPEYLTNSWPEGISLEWIDAYVIKTYKNQIGADNCNYDIKLNFDTPSTHDKKNITRGFWERIDFKRDIKISIFHKVSVEVATSATKNGCKKLGIRAPDKLDIVFNPSSDGGISFELSLKFDINAYNENAAEKSYKINGTDLFIFDDKVQNWKRIAADSTEVPA